MSRERDIYMAIMHAAANGRGLHLTAAEVWDLALDDAIETRAGNALNEDEHVGMVYKSIEFWRAKKPFQVGQSANLSGFSRDDPSRPRAPSPLQRTDENTCEHMEAEVGNASSFEQPPSPAELLVGSEPHSDDIAEGR